MSPFVPEESSLTLGYFGICLDTHGLQAILSIHLLIWLVLTYPIAYASDASYGLLVLLPLFDQGKDGKPYCAGSGRGGTEGHRRMLRVLWHALGILQKVSSSSLHGACDFLNAQEGFSALLQLDGWGNARDVDKVWKASLQQRADRVVNDPEGRTCLLAVTLAFVIGCVF